jgi:enamine deaminase RidA (YjgF/YER057c/UK114 family)
MGDLIQMREDAHDFPAPGPAGRRLISQGSRFEAEIGYSRAVVDGRWIFVSGTTGYDYASMTLADGVVAQCRQSLANIAAALAEAGASFDDALRVHYYLLDAAEFPPCFPLLREAFARSRPAATMLVVAGLADPAMRIEIELTARRPG